MRGANISHKYQFVWTAPAKVASRSVRDVFIEHCDLNPDWPSEEHPSNFTHVNNWPDTATDDYIHIVSVRHPYYRWLSYWKYAYWDRGSHEIPIALEKGPLECLKSMNDDWIDGWNLWNLVRNTNERIDHVIAAETIEEDLRELWFMPKDFKVPNIGKTTLPHGYLSVDEEIELRELCFKRFNNDYINFGYEKFEHIKKWDTIFPRI